MLHIAVDKRLAYVLAVLKEYNIRFPNAELVRSMHVNKGNVSRMLKGKLPISDNFLKTFVEKYPNAPKGWGESENDDLPLGNLRVTLKDHFDLLQKFNEKVDGYASAMQRIIEAKLLEPNSVEVKTGPTKKRPIVDLSALNPEVPVPPPGKPEEHRGAKRGSNRGEGKKNKR